MVRVPLKAELREDLLCLVGLTSSSTFIMASREGVVPNGSLPEDSSLRCCRLLINVQGIFCSLYTSAQSPRKQYLIFSCEFLLPFQRQHLRLPATPCFRRRGSGAPIKLPLTLFTWMPAFAAELGQLPMDSMQVPANLTELSKQATA